LEPYIRKIETDYGDMRETMLRAGLSGLGLAIIFHEVERGVRVLYETIEKTGDVTIVRTQAKELVRMLDGFTELLRKGDRRPRSLQLLLTRARDLNRVRFRTHHVRLVCPALAEGARDAEPSFTFGLVLGALNNILDNSFYWLRVRWPSAYDKPSARAIYMDINRDFPEGPALVIADTGPGFQDDPERLIRPFFSRRPEWMGLGLYYANLVMDLNGGRLLFPDAADLGVPAEFDGATIALVFNEGKLR
jgi:nitrogen fixation/metabolism regulation signal transduction histidine kinase